MTIRDLMSTELHACHPEDNLTAAARLMWDHDIGAVPVVDDAGALLGIITDRDICMATYLRAAGLAEIAVGDVMAKVVYTCKPTDAIGEVERIMKQAQIHRVPVVDGANRVVGMFTINDLTRWANQSHRRQAEAVATLAAISEPRRVTSLTSVA